MKVYQNNWEPCELIVNFNQKQWRQDLASYIVTKLNWFDARVSKSKVIEKSELYNNAVKEFEIYTRNGNSFKIKYSSKNKIIDCSNFEIVKNYLSLRSIKRGEFN